MAASCQSTGVACHAHGSMLFAYAFFFAMQTQQAAPVQPLQQAPQTMAGFQGQGERPMLPSDYKSAPPPTNSYQTDLALAAAANTMTPIPIVSHSFILYTCLLGRH